MAWWPKGHRYMEHLLKWTKSRFPPPQGQFRPILRTMQSGRVKEGAECFKPGRRHFAGSTMGLLDLRASLDRSLWYSKVGKAEGLSGKKTHLLNLSYSIQQRIIKVHFQERSYLFWHFWDCSRVNCGWENDSRLWNGMKPECSRIRRSCVGRKYKSTTG